MVSHTTLKKYNNVTVKLHIPDVICACDGGMHGACRGRGLSIHSAYRGRGLSMHSACRGRGLSMHSACRGRGLSMHSACRGHVQ